MSTVSIFGNHGAAGLPPLGDDDEQKRREQHGCPDCGAATEAGLAYCWDCSLRRVRNLKIAAAPVGQAAESEQQKIQRKSAPLFTLGAALDERCYWCCVVKNEHIASPLGDDRVWSVQPTVPPTRDAHGWLVPGYECALHLARRLAYEDANAAMNWMRQEGMSSEDIAEYFRYGYLGDYR